VCPALPPALDAPLLAFLEKEPEKRPPSVTAGLDALAAAAAGAGFDVKVIARRSGGAETPTTTVHVGGGVTPVEAEARTILGTSDTGKTVIGVEAPPKPANGRPFVYGAAGAALLLAAIGIGVVTQRPHGPAAAPTAVPAALPAASALPAATVLAPVAEVAPSVTAEVVPPAEVELTIDATPKVVDVYQGAAKIGTSEAPVRVKRAAGNVKLTIKAPGYDPKDVEVPASANGTTTVALKKAGHDGGDPQTPGPAGKRGKKGELEF
jgi:hypothetical protein